MAELTQARRQADQDLEAAGRIQRSMLPSTPPPVPRVRFAWSFESSSQVGGDMFDVVDLGEGKVGVYVMDVCGTGAHAALLAVSIGWTLSPSGVLTTSASEGARVAASPADVARELNRRFPVLSRSDQYFSFLYGVLDTRTRCFDYVRAGHPAPIGFTARGVHPLPLPAGPPLGVLSEVELEVESEVLALAPGDAVLFYTDGLLRALGQMNRPASEEDLAHFLEPLAGKGIQAAVDALVWMARSAWPAGMEDDVALVGFELTGPGED